MIGKASAGNIISGNTGYGILISGSPSVLNVIEANYIGTDVTGTIAMGNLIGIGISSSDNRIGGSTVGAGNVISGQTQYGIAISSSSGNLVQGNYIGTNATGDAELGNTLNGVRIGFGAQANVIGTDGDGVNDGTEGNVISGNDLPGVHIFGIETDFNVV